MSPRKFLLAAAALTALSLLATACSSGGDSSGPVAPPPAPPAPPLPPPPPPPPPASVERDISPQSTNAAITQNNLPHFVINPSPSVTPAQRLFVFLPGTGAPPAAYEDIVRFGASRGYHALGLTYINNDAIEVLCGASTDPDCAEDARREVITGASLSPLVNVDPTNSIDGRLLSLLTFLSTNFPAEGWGQYISNGAVNWSLVNVAGHSQGAGHSGFMAKIRDLNRVVMFSGPGDTGVGVNTPAAWTSLPNVTPVARQFGFTHTADNLAPLSAVTRNWESIDLDMFGPAVSVDGASAPFSNSHQLLTSAPPNPNPIGVTASPTHGAPVVDAVTPRDAQGIPIYQPVWAFLAFP